MQGSIVSINKNIQGGTPCFAGTRVPVSSLFDHLEGGYTIDYFVNQFPSVRLEQVIALLYPNRLGEILTEMCRELGVSSLFEYLTQQNGFFAYHLASYSIKQGRRKAPIYWPLQSKRRV